MLTGSKIKEEIECGRIVCTPYDEKYINPNSIDVRLGDELKFYKPHTGHSAPLDPKDPYADHKLVSIEQNGDKWFLHPGELYISTTIEACGSDHYIPMINGKSSLGRLGINIHVTAGFGDIGFKQKWTLEIVVVKEVILYPGMRIGQVCFFEPFGNSDVKYAGKYATQTNAQGSIPYTDESEYSK